MTLQATRPLLTLEKHSTQQGCIFRVVLAQVLQKRHSMSTVPTLRVSQGNDHQVMPRESVNRMHTRAVAYPIQAYLHTWHSSLADTAAQISPTARAPTRDCICKFAMDADVLPHIRCNMYWNSPVIHPANPTREQHVQASRGSLIDIPLVAQHPKHSGSVSSRTMQQIHIEVT